MSGYTALAMDQRQIPRGVAVLEKPFTVGRLDDAIATTLGDLATDPSQRLAGMGRN